MLLEKIILKIKKRLIVRDYNKYCSKKTGHAILYFKTDSLFLKRLAKKYSHVNFWEVLEITKILNRFGYWVDIYDRAVDFNKEKIDDKYNLFIGISAGMSGKWFTTIAKQVKSAIKVAFVSSQDPEVYNAAIIARYKYFSERHPGVTLPLVGTKENLDMNDIANHSDAIFCEGEEFTLNQYRKYNKPVHQIFVPSSPKVLFNLSDVYSRNKKKFLYFGSNRNILKGLDILIEVFSDLPADYELYICTPAKEHEFDLVYKDILNSSKNIHWMGFIDVGGPVFETLTKDCVFNILLSCSDSMATSVTTCMRNGMIPIITPETDIGVDGFGYLIKDISIESVKREILSISQISDQEVVERSINSYLASEKYTQDNFSRTFETALLDVIKKWKIKSN